MAFQSQRYGIKKDTVWMPFGSGMNAWAIANQGAGIDANEVAKAMEIIYSKAKELVNKEEAPAPVVNVYHRNNEQLPEFTVDLPIK